MRLDKALYHRSYWFFIIFFIAMLAAFWYTYLTRIAEQPSYRMHLHGLIMLLWCLLLILQPLLVHYKKTAWHRSTGKTSYILVPLLIFTTVDLLHYRLSAPETMGAMDYHFAALVLNALVAFLIFYGLAIYHRKKPLIHGRYMVLSAFPMVTPITDRIIFIFFPALVPHLPTIAGQPIAPVVGFALADLLLAGFIWWDFRSHRRWKIFTFGLLVLLLYHYSVLTFHQYSFWQDFTRWFKGASF